MALNTAVTRTFYYKIIAMKQPYLKVNPANHFTKDLFKLRQALNCGNTVHSNKSCMAGEKGNNQNSVTKNDSLILHDFFGALNY